MSERLDKLVTLYGRQSVEQVKNDPTLLEQAFGKSLENLASEIGFRKDQELVESLKSHIEGHLHVLDTPDRVQQIAQCLKMLLKIAMYDRAAKSMRDLKIETMGALFEQMFSSGWSNSRKAHFGFVKEKIKHWNSYFISYANGGAKVINSVYRSVIDLYVEPEVIRQRNPDEDNLLVDAIVNRLQKRLMIRSFYDRKDIKLGDNLNLKIGTACKNIFVFLQLVQLETFDVFRDRNWCFEEYTHFHRSNEEELAAHTEYRDVFHKRFFAILAGDKPDDVCPPDVPFEYEPWSLLIFNEKHHLPLPKDTVEFDKAIAKIADELLQTSYQIIENVPA